MWKNFSHSRKCGSHNINILGKVIRVIVAERKEKAVMDNFGRFGDAMPDGRLTALSNGRIYRLREVILSSKQLGRPLTEDEMRLFEIQERSGRNNDSVSNRDLEVLFHASL